MVFDLNVGIGVTLINYIIANFYLSYGFAYCYSLDGGYAAWQARPRQPARAERRVAEQRVAGRG